MVLLAKKKTYICLHVLNTIILTAISAIHEKRSSLRNLQDKIEVRKSIIDQKVYTKLFTKIAEGNYIVVQRDSKLLKYLGNTNPLSDLYLIGKYGIPKHISLEDIPYLETEARYFFIEIKDIPIHRIFVKQNLHSFMYIKGFNLGPDKDEIDQMVKISQECLRAFDRIGNIEMAAKDMIVKIRKVNPFELFINHSEGFTIMKSIFNHRNEFLEDLKVHFVKFMSSIFFGMKTSSFCDAYVKSIISYLERENILAIAPSIKEYPELIHRLFPYKIISTSPNILHEELIVGGISLDGILQDKYLRELFNLGKIKEITRGGSRFIFTGHISIDNQKGKYNVSFV
ncbi:uncharacterized protein Eint_020300 [Encephalitozoon intestinalis ATCC 50506]|uniref:Uncharacterized protein n=1 Tax=Encephalitozoon intestinalis (strain ATCC 50506) TaxID=876142 RepID=E0S5P6_ENCIT|nr:uncharacterized protein Eint_020300 [Encephalitozoon intestinalis ATCC 50506]ADM11031.1 hypothetical protein Eint_020300 [Encephalitozoon intestinalis ATCC 50506]UTX44679.1 hypothetical protein GPK93_02g01940 [Encephalitozoon intestinalis]